jgi:16S rRNA (guanine527-N7)-methyltransferase
MSPEPADPPLPADRFQALLEERSVALGIKDSSLPPALARYLAELDSWRRRMNLAGRLSASELAEHAFESLAANDLIPHGERLADIGSGAGFPGMPIALARPDLEVSLVEPRAKRAAFLRHVVRALGLRRVEVLEKRSEEVGGQTFGVATSRAVGNLSSTIGEALFLRPEGLLLLWTTDEAARGLPPEHWRRERVIPIAGSDRRTVTAFQKLD